MNTTDFSYRRIMTIAWPVVVTQMTHTAMLVIDTIMVGQLGVTALAAVGLATFLGLWILAFFHGLFAGLSTMVAQAVGANKPRAAAGAMWQGLYLALASGVLLALTSIWAPRLLPWVGGDPAVLAIASDYVSIQLFGGLALTLFLVADNFYRGLGETRLPMVCGLAQLVINCGLNYALIFGRWGAPELGVVGAAWGTIVAQLIVALALLATIALRRQRFADFDISGQCRLARDKLTSLLRLSLPIGIQCFMEMGGIAVFCALIARIGAGEMAATNAVIRAWSAGYMGAFALSVSASTLVGQAVGAGQADKARLAVRRVSLLGCGLAAILGVIYLAVPEWLMAQFIDDQGMVELAPLARPLFIIVTVCLFIDMRFNILFGGLRGAGDTRYPMLVNIFSAWLVFVPTTFIAVRSLGLIGAWWCLVLHTAVMMLCLEHRFRGRGWMDKAVVTEH